MGGFNDLATLLPDIAAEWSDRNYPLLPTQVTVFANRKAWWKCKDCGREWNTLISTRCKLWDAGEKGLTLSAFEWEEDRKTLIYGQVDYMYGEALYKPEMKEGVTALLILVESRVLIMIFNCWFIPYGNKSSSNLYFSLIDYISVRNEI